MNVILERPDEAVVLIKCELPAEEVSKRFDELVRENAQRIAIPGFRPGKAPKSVIMARYGDAFKNDLTVKLINEILSKAIEQEPALEKPLFIDEPKFEPVEDGKPFSVEIYVELPPKVELQKYKEFELKRPIIPVPKEEVDAMIDEFLLRNATLEPQKRPVQENDYVEVKLSLEDDEPSPILVPLDDPEFLNYFGDLIGKEVGEKIEKNLSFPDSFPDRRLQGKSGNFVMEISNVFEQVKPELNAEFFKKLGKPEGYTAEDFRKEVEDFARANRSKASDDLVFERLVDALIEANPVKIPPKYFEKQVEEYIQENLDVSKIPQDEMEKIRGEVEDRVRRRILYKFLVDAVADAENIEPSEQDVIDGMRNWAQSVGINPDVVQKTITEDPQRYEDFKHTVRREKAIEFILSTCKIVDEEISKKGDEQKNAPPEDAPQEREVNEDESQLQTS